MRTHLPIESCREELARMPHQWTSEEAAEAARQSHEVRRRRAELTPRQRAEEAISRETGALVKELLDAARGRNDFEGLPADLRLRALLKALEYGLGKATTTARGEDEEPEPPQLFGPYEGEDMPGKKAVDSAAAEGLYTPPEDAVDEEAVEAAAEGGPVAEDGDEVVSEEDLELEVLGVVDDPKLEEVEVEEEPEPAPKRKPRKRGKRKASDGES
jgi:hypothetical protein